MRNTEVSITDGLAAPAVLEFDGGLPAGSPGAIEVHPPLADPLDASATSALSAVNLSPPSSPSPEFLSLIPHAYARRHLVLSTGCDSDIETLSVGPRTRPTAWINVGVRLGRKVVVQQADAERIAAEVDLAYAKIAEANPSSSPTHAREDPVLVIEAAMDVEGELAATVREAERDLLNLDGKGPSIRLVDLILFEALRRGASDVHVQPIKDKTLVRYRLDGALHTVRELPGSLASSVVSRVKVMARLDVAERRAPQDGRATVSIGGSRRGDASGMPDTGRNVDLRVSTLPSTYGERVVLRLLDPTRTTQLSTFDGIGMPDDLRDTYLAQASRTSGIVLSTGPTGSGKTTTLYATLSWISSTNAGGQRRGCELNMMTIEDPVEYDLSASGLSISQTQVDPKKNVTFATGLRHILRQDPDVIMVGEVRDDETAKIAVQASLTGHLVLSTLHTNDAPSAVVRLIDLGVEPFLVASSLAAVLAQRLVRKTHQPCRGMGCEVCIGTGYKGRIGVFELLVLDAELRELVVTRAPAMRIKEAAQHERPNGGRGMVTLREAGSVLVRDGLTTAQEVARVIESLAEVDV